MPRFSFLYWLAFLITALAIVAVAVWWFWDVPLISPLTSHPLFQFLTDQPPAASKGKVVYGFLPYWNVEKVTLQPELTNLSYFSLGINSDGTLQTKNGNASEPGYSKLQSDTFLELANQQTRQKGKVELVLSQFDNDAIVQLLTNTAAQDRLTASLDSALLAYPFSGVNIDIEYTGEVTPNLRAAMVTTMKKIRQHLNQNYKNMNLSIDVYASASTSNQIWDLKPLSEQVNYIIIMAYDFHQRSSPEAGPVAPLFGAQQYWTHDISEQLQAFVQQVPSHKLLLGVPFYGYEWQTTSDQAQANTFPDTGSTASFQYVQDLMARKDELQIQEKWNDAALSPYLTYKEKGKNYVVYYENSRSISYKLDFVNQLDLGGIAIWALGYEGNSRELWDTVHQKLDAP